jgi:hypothetical protein
MNPRVKQPIKKHQKILNHTHHIKHRKAASKEKTERKTQSPIMNYIAASLLVALAAPTSMAFQSPAPRSTSTSLHNALRDMAAFPDDMKMMSEFEAFDRNGAFSRSPQQVQYQQQGGGGGGGGGGYGPPPPGMMGGGGGNPNPFARRGGGGGGGGIGGRSLDGFDPHSAFGNNYGMSQSDMMMRGPPPPGMGMDYGMDYYGPPDMQMMMMMGGPRGGGGGGRMGGGGGMMNNGVRDTNTMGGFSYSSRVRDYAGYDQGMGGGYEGGPMMMGGGGGGYDGPMMGGGGGGGEMEYDQMYDQQQQQQRGGGYGGFGGDMSRMGP